MQASKDRFAVKYAFFWNVKFKHDVDIFLYYIIYRYYSFAGADTVRTASMRLHWLQDKILPRK